MRRTGIKTKRAVVEEALRTLIQLKRQEEVLALRGKLHWEGDLDQMRCD
jgi:Arc/MetJ family transcription regulator